MMIVMLHGNSNDSDNKTMEVGQGQSQEFYDGGNFF